MPLFALCHIPKTAGTTLIGILRRSFGNAHCDVEPITGRTEPYGSRDLHLAQRLHPGLASIAGHQLTPSADLEDRGADILYYMVFREPLARLASQYQGRARRGNPPRFSDMIRNPWWRDRQARQVAGVADAQAAVDVIVRKQVLVGLIDGFDEFLLMLRSRWGDARLDIRYRRRNVAPSNQLAKRLLTDPAVRHDAEEVNPADFELWRRLRDEIYPAQRAQFPGLDRELTRFRQEPAPSEWTPRVLVGGLHRNLLYKPALHTLRRLC